MAITFRCTKCGQDLEIEESGAGLTVQCPKCAHEVVVPLSSRQNTLAATIRLSPIPAAAPASPPATAPSPATHVGAPPAPAGTAKSEPPQRRITNPAFSGVKTAPMSARPAPRHTGLRTIARLSRTLALIVVGVTVLVLFVAGPAGRGLSAWHTVVRVLVIVDLGAFVCLSLLGVAGLIEVVLDLEERSRAEK